MHPFTLRLSIASSLFILIASGSVVWFVSQIPAQPRIPELKSVIDIPAADAVLDSTIYPVPFCDLIKYPERYHRKLIRTRAIVDNGVDWASLRSDACPDDDGVVGAVGAIEPTDKFVESTSRRKIGLIISRLVREGWDGPLEVQADMVGRFYGGQRNGRSHQFAILYEFDAKPTKKRW